MIRVDHVTFAGPDLEALQRSFAAVGLVAEYGGSHSNGVTHMAILSFEDGSYFELISTLEPGTAERSPLWGAHIAGDSGPCAWAVVVADLDAEAVRLRELGVAVAGPMPLQRQRPDGVRAELLLAFPGTEAPGATLPFVVQDVAPRSFRVPPASAPAGLTGVARVVLGVPELAPAVELLRRAYGWPEPRRGTVAATPGVDGVGLAARLAWFPDAPVILAAPAEDDGWLACRLARFGPCPAAILLGSHDLGASAAALPGELIADRWLDQPLRWFDPRPLGGVRLGVIGV